MKLPVILSSKDTSALVGPLLKGKRSMLPSYPQYGVHGVTLRDKARSCDIRNLLLYCIE